MSAWRPLLRLARKDARRHPVRTLLATALVALPACAMVGFIAVTQTGVPSREAALASIPDGVQAVVTATTVLSDAPLPQPPEGLPAWIDDPSRRPMGEREIAGVLAPANRVLRYWNSPRLLVTTGVDDAVGAVRPAGAGTEGLLNERRSSIVPATLQEAGREALGHLVPTLREGAMPAQPGDVVVSAALADQAGARLGSVVTLVAAPWNGWMSTDGRIGAVVANQQKTFRVIGIASGTALRAWSLHGWVSALVSADPAGVDGHYLIVGPEPVTWQQAKALNEGQAFAVSRHVLTNYPSAGELYPVPINARQIIERTLTLGVIATLGAALLVGLVTPAFAVAAEQQRRLLGLASATGAAPRDLRRMITAQGVLVGAAGGVVGGALGLVASAVVVPIVRPGVDVWGYFPWWVLPAALAVTVVLGWVTTLLPARWAGRQHPIDALRGRTSVPVSRRSRSWRLALGPGLVVTSVLTAIGSLALPVPEMDPATGVSAPPVPQGALLAATLVCFIVGLMLCSNVALSLVNRVARRLPLATRSAVHDSAAHRSRVVPATAAVTVSVVVASFALVLAASGMSHERDRLASLLDPGRLALGLYVPVSDALDRAVVLDAVEQLKQRFPVVGSEPVYLFAEGQSLRVDAEPPEVKRCPQWFAPDYRSALEPGAQVRCVPDTFGYVPQVAAPCWFSGASYVMSGAALLAGRPEAVSAARVLDGGGVLVRDARALAQDGTVTIKVLRSEGDRGVVAEVRLPGAFFADLGAPVVFSPAAAARFGDLTQRYVGEVVVSSRALSPGELGAANALLAERAPLIWPGVAIHQYSWGQAEDLVLPLAAVAIAVLATVIATSLARTQSYRDLSTMHAVGAHPGFLRRYLAAQVGLIMGIGVPLGVLGGLGLGSYVVAWNRELWGGWRLTVYNWGWQAGVAALLVASALAVAWVVGRPPRQLTARLAD